MSEITETEVVKHITNSLNEMYTKGYVDALNSQPQLTIPKSVAKQADKSSFNEMITLGAQAFYWWFNHEQDEYIPVVYAYLAGKALGVDLVKVVEG